jgi:hypothetical protein
MKVSFFEQWVTFIPETRDVLYSDVTGDPLTITINRAMRLACAVLSDNGFAVPVPTAAALGGGCETVHYPFIAGEAIHEAVILDRATFIYNSYFTHKKLNIQ